MINPNTDYISTNFEYPILTKIYWIPTYEALRRIKDEMKDSWASELWNLGGGSNGHLGLMLIAATYMNAAVIPCVCHIYPGILDMAVSTVNYEATRLREEHKVLIRWEAIQIIAIGSLVQR